MEQLIDTKAAAELLGLRVSTVRKYTMLRLLPYRKHGTRVVFSPSELEAWSNARRFPALGIPNYSNSAISPTFSNQSAGADNIETPCRTCP